MAVIDYIDLRAQQLAEAELHANYGRIPNLYQNPIDMVDTMGAAIEHKLNPRRCYFELIRTGELN